MDPDLNQYLIYGGGALALVVTTVVVALRARKRPPAELAPPSVPADPGAPAPAEPAAPGERTLREGLGKTRSGFVARIATLLGKKQFDEQFFGELEEVLFTADIGAKTAEKLLAAVKSSLSQKQLDDPEIVWRAIREESQRILTSAQEGAGPLDLTRKKPFVVLVVGVNGVGKTTSIGKLAAKWRAEGKRVLMAAGDTFRAAAAEQLEIWGQRSGAAVVRGKEGGDPSAVIFDAVKKAQAEGFDIVLADTAGRLHTKTELMEELQKVRRVVQKAMPDAPHETLLVLDSTNGQNAIAQATLFKQATQVSGIVLTKLDGTAKGGVILGICDELKVPVRYIGIGEKVEDLRPFEAGSFVEALFT